VQDYLELAGEFARGVDERNIAVALELARLPDDIRGFGHVKERNLQAAQTRRAELLRQYREPGLRSKAA